MTGGVAAPFGGDKIIFRMILRGIRQWLGVRSTPPLGPEDMSTGLSSWDKTMVSVSLRSWLMLNCKLSGRTKSGCVLTVDK